MRKIESAHLVADLNIILPEEQPVSRVTIHQRPKKETSEGTSRIRTIGVYNNSGRIKGVDTKNEDESAMTATLNSRQVRSVRITMGKSITGSKKNTGYTLVIVPKTYRKKITMWNKDIDVISFEIQDISEWEIPKR